MPPVVTAMRTTITITVTPTTPTRTATTSRDTFTARVAVTTMARQPPPRAANPSASPSKLPRYRTSTAPDAVTTTERPPHHRDHRQITVRPASDAPKRSAQARGLLDSIM